MCLQFTPSCSPSPPHSPPSAPRGHLHCPPNLEAPPFALRSMLMSFLLIAAGAEVPVPRLPAGRCGKADFGRRQRGGTLHVLRLTAASLIARFEPDLPGPSRQRGGAGVRRYRTRTPTSGTIQWGIASELIGTPVATHAQCLQLLSSGDARPYSRPLNTPRVCCDPGLPTLDQHRTRQCSRNEACSITEVGFLLLEIEDAARALPPARVCHLLPTRKPA